MTTDKFDPDGMPTRGAVVLKRVGPAPKAPTAPIVDLAKGYDKVNTNHSAYSAGKFDAYQTFVASPKQDFHTGVRSAKAVPTPTKGQH